MEKIYRRDQSCREAEDLMVETGDQWIGEDDCGEMLSQWEVGREKLLRERIKEKDERVILNTGPSQMETTPI